MDVKRTLINTSKQQTSSKTVKRPYNTPQLEELANLRDITLGGSGPGFDAFSPGTEKPDTFI
jgi:hypothetical protein